MNKENLLKVAELVEKGSHKFNGIHAAFNMANWIEVDIDKDIPLYLAYKKRTDVEDPHVCNTTACIAGFAALLSDYETFKHADCITPADEIVSAAREYLGLTEEQAEDLFCGYTSGYVTGPQAAKVIRNFVETGKIDWEDVRNEIELRI